ncbi:pH-response regulator protein palF/RIM8 [Paramyrothecium foliicola]|nr:pH-response regulator protein palF/RIM8 [Paramyrothecium foliicola]
MSTSSPSLPNANANATAAAASPDDSRSTTPTPSRPSLLSRLSLPLTLRNRNRHVADFHVRPDEPYRNYSAGNHVRGAVVLAIVKPVRMTHLVVTLHGYVHVVKDPVAMAKAQPAAPRGGSSVRPQYHGNGLASLFQDEQVLSGEGRLEAGKYEFGFDLVFPEKGLPSSIDFERGTISYMITATLTRPTSIAPTVSCDRKVMLVEQVDIGRLSPPRPRTIFLEPISRRTRRKKSMALEKTPSVAPDTNEIVSESESAEPSSAIEESSRDAPSESRSPIQSDMRSEVSGGSGRSTGSVVSRAEFAQLSQVGTTLTSSAKQQVVDDKTITATIELVKGGCLPGDTVSVRVTVQHIKLVKSMTGVVVTLFRQGKIDTAPPSSKFEDTAGKLYMSRAQKEEAYPRSRLGLGGLSLSSTGSTSVFRKDLDQNTAPLIIDPSTMQASVTVSVKVPDDSFPTIKGVPGDMVTFKYQVEVIVDLGGRLSNLLQGAQTPARFGTFNSNNADQGNTSFGPRRGINIADTSQLRRGKGVVAVSMETVVGSVDSSKTQKQRVSPARTIQIAGDGEDGNIRPELAPTGATARESGVPNGQSPAPYHPPGAEPAYFSSPPPSSAPLHPLAFQSAPSNIATPLGHFNQHETYSNEATPSYIPPPEMPDHANMTEKQRVQQAEMRLLPSQPPQFAGPSAPTDDAPLAPSVPDDDIYDADVGFRPQHPTGLRDIAESGPSAPTQDDISIATVREDKQERERRRLMNEASSPPEVPSDVERRLETPTHADAGPDLEPSAPVLDDDDDDPYSQYGVGAGPSGASSRRDVEQLPAYER